MKKYISIISIYTLSIILSGCSVLPSWNFEIKSTDDKFTTTQGIYRVTGDNNKLTEKTVGDYTSYDYRGLYINPHLSIDTINHKLLYCGLSIVSFDYAYPYGNIFGIIDQLIIITDKNEKIELYPKRLDYSVSPTMSEIHSVDISLKDYIILSNANWIELKFYGSNITRTYNKEDVLPSFLNNLKSFNKATFKYFIPNVLINPNTVIIP